MPAYKMRFIENYELREWVKDNLRKTIFQKAHALAVQTGCEILVKLEDNDDITGSQYYATNTLESAFNGDGLRKKTVDMSVSGETGLPIATMVDRAIQSATADISSESATVSLPNASSQSVEEIAQRLSSNKAVSAGGDGAVPMQLTLVQDSFTKLNSQTESSPVQLSTQTELSLEEQSGDPEAADITVKMEPMTEDEPPDPGLSNNGDTETYQTDQANQMLFSMGTSNQEMGYSAGTSQDVIGGMTRDTKLYPVPISPKPYQCAVCHKAFRSVQVLQKHTQTFHMRPQSMHVLSKRGRGRGRATYSRSSPFQHHQFASQPQTPRFLCVICNRVFREAHILEDHMARSHMSQATPPPPVPSQSSFDESIASQLTALTGDISFQQEDSSSLTVQNPEDIPGPSSVEGSSAPMSQIPQGATVTFGQQPQCSVNAPAISNLPPPSMYSGFTPPSAPLRTNTSMVAGSSSYQASPSRNKGTSNRSSHRRQSQQLITVRSIMSGILLTAGPISTHSAFTRLGPNQLRCATKEQYVQAAKALQDADLGQLLTLQNISRLSSVFLKRSPEEVTHILQMNPDLCSVSVYAARFNLPVPSCINKKVPEKLAELGYLAETKSYFGT